MEFLVRGATAYGEPGVFVAFEETAQELVENVRSLGFDLDVILEIVIQREDLRLVCWRVRRLLQQLLKLADLLQLVSYGFVVLQIENLSPAEEVLDIEGRQSNGHVVAPIGRV